MKRRNFLKATSAGLVALPVSFGFIQNVQAQVAANDIIFEPFPGTNGSILFHDLFELPNRSEAFPNGKMKCSLYKFAPNSFFPKHTHPEGEYNFVIEGSYEVGGITYQQGDFSFMPPASVHELTKMGETGTTILTVTPIQIQIVK